MNQPFPQKTADAFARSGPLERHPLALATLAILILFTIVSYIDRMVIMLMVEPIRADLQITDFQISLLTGAAFALCFATASLPLSWLADRYSRRWVIYGGVTVWSLATAAGGIANSFGEMFAARFFVGVGEAALAPAAFAMIPDLFPRREVALATGTLAAAAAVGGGLAILGGGFLIEWLHSIGTVTLPVLGEVRSWQMVFIALGLPGLLIALLIFIVPEQRHDFVRTGARPSQAAYVAWLRRNWLFVLGISLGCSSLAAVAYGAANWTPTFLLRTLGLSLADVAMTLGIVQMICGVVGFVGSGAIIDWTTARNVTNASHRYLIGASILIGIAGFCAFTIAPNLAVVMVFLGLFHLALPYPSALIAALQKGAPRAYRGQVIAIGTMLPTLIGLIVGPSAVALLTERVFGDPKAVGYSIATFSVIGCAIAIACFVLSYSAARRTIAETQEQEASSG